MITTQPKYFHQYLRMKRWYWRLQPLSGGKENSFSSYDTYRDDFFIAFFFACQHFKDWLGEYLEEMGIGKKGDIENYIKSSTYLKECDAVFNYAKHAKLDPNRDRVGRDNTIKACGQMISYYSEQFQQDIIVSRYEIKGAQKTYDAFELAENCLKEWDDFLRSKKLEIPELIEEKMYLCFK